MYMYVHKHLPREHILQGKLKHEASRNNIIDKVTAKDFLCIYTFFVSP